MRWFGSAWKADVCTFGDQIDTPVNIPCPLCQELIKEGDQGLMIATVIRWEGDNCICREVPHHKRCLLAHIEADMQKFLNMISPGGKPEPTVEPDPETCEHDWFVYSTATANQPKILVQCCKCCVLGSTMHFTAGEWGQAFHAPTSPFRWRGPVETVGTRPADLAEGIPLGGIEDDN
jgi:hypothetical protein